MDDRGDGISQSVQNGLNRIFEFLPQLLGALVVLLIGYFVAKAVAALVKRVLSQIGFDRALSSSPAGGMLNRMMSNAPSAFVGAVTFWLLWLGAISLAVTVLSIDALTNFVGAIYAYLPNVLAAVLIFLVASAVSAGATALVQRVMGGPTARLLSVVVPAFTMSIAVFMILDQLGIAENIVSITYTAIMAALALGLGLAFGLGGRDIAARLLDQAYGAAQRNVGTAKADVARAKENTKREADRVRRERS